MAKMHLIGLLLCLVVLSACVPDVVRHNETGNTRFEEKAYEEAIDAYRLAQVAEPDLAEPYYNAANAYNRMNELDGTQVQTEQALKTAEPALAAQAWYNLGNAHFDAQQWPQTIEAYKQALRLQPDDQDAKHNLELALQKLQEQQQQEQQQQQQQESPSEKQEQEQQGGKGQENEQAEATPQPEEEKEQEEESNTSVGQQATPQPSEESQAESGGEASDGLTQEQAIQLLQALLSDSETLQEKLQEIYQAPGSPPEQDW